MKLQTYRKEQGMNRSQLGRLLGVSGVAVARYETEVRIPTRDVMAKILEVTEGKVTPNDFYEATQ